MTEIASAQMLARPARPAFSSHSIYTGPERRHTDRDAGPFLTRMLDEVDYGMLLVNADIRVVYMNHAARKELDCDHPLQVHPRERLLVAHRPQDVAPLYDALAAARRGLRRLLTLGEGVNRIALSVVPLLDGGGVAAAGAARPGAVTMLMLGKREVCAQLSVRGYARSQNLTTAETRVLELLCSGLNPSEIAKEVGVKVSTVRTQIGSVRAKTGAASIRDLVRQVAVLPPLVNALRTAGPAAPLQD